jgi:hypothetical protein
MFPQKLFYVVYRANRIYFYRDRPIGKPDFKFTRCSFSSLLEAAKFLSTHLNNGSAKYDVKKSSLKTSSEELYRRLAVFCNVVQTMKKPKVGQLLTAVAGLDNYSTLFWFSELSEKYSVRRNVLDTYRVASAFKILNLG